jgi:hypothetical protein
MNKQCVYHIQLRGQIDEAEINAMSPLKLARKSGDTAVTQFSVRTDQSGLVGLIRYLHSLGFVFLSLIREQPLNGPGP